MLDFVKSVERRDPIPFCVGRVIEDLIDKVINPRIKTHCDLSDVDHFSCSPTNDVDPQNFQRIRMKEDLK